MHPLLRELLLAWRLARSPAMETVLARAGLAQPAPQWGIDWVEVDGPLYRPAGEGGTVAAILGAREDGKLIDLVATSLETRAMRRRRGLAMLLGHDHIALSRERDRPLAVFADGLSWLAGGGAGVVVLDWRHGWYELADAPALACPTEALALRLKRAFGDGVVSPPPIFVPASNPQERRHAA